MKIVKCKVCGKNIEADEKDVIVEHKCGVEVVLPKNSNEELLEKYNTGYQHLKAMDFKKATEVFKSIAEENPKEYEAYWCLALCCFGVEYYRNTISKATAIYTHYTGLETFSENEYCKKAIKSAPKAVKEKYTEISQKIDETLKLKIEVDEELNRIFGIIGNGEFVAAENALNELQKKYHHESRIFVGKLLCELRFTDINQLSTCDTVLTMFTNYNYAVQFADKETKMFLNSFNTAISERIREMDSPNEGIETISDYEYPEYDEVPNSFFLRIWYSIKGFFIFLGDICKNIFANKKLFITVISVVVIITAVVCGVYFLTNSSSEPTTIPEADRLLRKNQFYEAAQLYAENKSDIDVIAKLKSDKFIQGAIDLYQNGKIRECIKLCNLCGINQTGNEDIDRLITNKLSSAKTHVVAILSDGSVAVTAYEGYEYYGEGEVSNWEAVISVATGEKHTICLKSDGNVVATGDNRFGQCNVKDWKNVIAVSAGQRHSVGLLSDGTVVATEYDGKSYNNQCEVGTWRNVVAISAGSDFTAALFADGTVSTTDSRIDTSKWRQIVSVSAGSNHILGLKSDGTVVAALRKDDTDYGQTSVSDWNDVIKISAGGRHSLALKANGEVLSSVYFGDFNEGQCNVDEWKSATDISAGFDFSIARGKTEKFYIVGDKDKNIDINVLNYGASNIQTEEKTQPPVTTKPTTTKSTTAKPTKPKTTKPKTTKKKSDEDQTINLDDLTTRASAPTEPAGTTREYTTAAPETTKPATTGSSVQTTNKPVFTKPE